MREKKRCRPISVRSEQKAIEKIYEGFRVEQCSFDFFIDPCLLHLFFLSFLSFCFDSKKKEMEGKERESTATDAYKTIFSTEIRVSTNLTILLYSLMRNMGEKID